MELDLPYIQQGSQEVEVLSLLSSGGSKTVLEVSFDGLRRALAIPNVVDSPDIREAKWQRVLKEPEYTTYLRNNGLLVNPYCEVDDFCVNGESTPVLVMTPFSELPFEVYDGKNGSKTWESGPLSHIENYRDLLPAISGVSQDIQKLAMLGAKLTGDSISFAVMPNKDLRLFLFDLEGMQMGMLPMDLRKIMLGCR
ncbi:MAG TPA: hypothetical protein VK983_01440 [Candidatus Limnocylindrales bacterium]|nr:hypothetical protein [Candidatus Limnocylindrales bacterium]